MDRIVYGLVFTFIIGIVIVYFAMNTVSYDSFDDAIKKTSNGGRIITTFDFDKGTFTFINNSHIKYEYYYLQDKKWYNKGLIYKKTYEIEDKYHVIVYYVKKNEISFIQVESEKELSNLTDTLNTEFKRIDLRKKETVYFGGNYKRLPDDYRLYINDKEYLLKEYNSLFKLFS